MDWQRLADEQAISALLYRYARAVDTKDWALYRSVFTDDAVIDYTSAGGSPDPATRWPIGLPPRSPRSR